LLLSPLDTETQDVKSLAASPLCVQLVFWMHLDTAMCPVARKMAFAHLLLTG